MGEFISFGMPWFSALLDILRPLSPGWISGSNFETVMMEK
jgi:hypothetical protein